MAPVDIVERLRWSISADTPARYPDIVSAAIDEIERLRAALDRAVNEIARLNRIIAEMDQCGLTRQAAEVLHPCQEKDNSAKTLDIAQIASDDRSRPKDEQAF